MRLNWVKGILAISLALIVSLGYAKETFIEGQHYFLLERPGKSQSKSSDLTVNEFFSYGCPHCFRLEPHLVSWKKKKADDVVFVKTPTAWNPYYTLLAQAYYTAELLNLDDAVHLHIFNAIHRGRKNLQTEAGIKEVMVDFGVDAAAFDKTFNSFGVDQKLKAGNQAFASYRVVGQESPKDRLSSVPTLVVGDLYVTDVGKAGGPERLIEVIEFLLAKIRTESTGTSTDVKANAEPELPASASEAHKSEAAKPGVTQADVTTQADHTGSLDIASKVEAPVEEADQGSKTDSNMNTQTEQKFFGVM